MNVAMIHTAVIEFARAEWFKRDRITQLWIWAETSQSRSHKNTDKAQLMGLETIKSQITEQRAVGPVACWSGENFP